MFTAMFWKDLEERAGKTFVQTFVATLTTAGITATTAGLKTVLINAAVAAVLSTLTSLLSTQVPGADVPTASLVRSIRRGKHEAAHPPTPEV